MGDRAYVVACIALAIGVTACETTTRRTPCQQDEDCPEGRYCAVTGACLNDIPTDDQGVRPDGGRPRDQGVPDADAEPLPDAAAPRDAAPDAEPEPPVVCPPAVDWRRDSMLWVAHADGVAGHALTPLYQGQPLDGTPVVHLPLERQAPLRGLALQPDGLGAVAWGEQGPDAVDPLFSADLATGRWRDALPGRPGRQPAFDVGRPGERVVAAVVLPDNGDTAVAYAGAGGVGHVVRFDHRSGQPVDADPTLPGVQALNIPPAIGLAAVDDRLYVAHAAGVERLLPARAVLDDRRPEAVAASPAATWWVAGGELLWLPVDAAEPSARALEGPTLALAAGADEALFRVTGPPAAIERLTPEGRAWATPLPGGEGTARLAVSADGAFVFATFAGAAEVQVLSAADGALGEPLALSAPAAGLAALGPHDDPERCNGEDDDCDGRVDERFGVGRACEGVGACGAGVVECAGPLATRCSSDPEGSAPGVTAEVCNGEDDDCDGEVDEVPPLDGELVRVTSRPGSRTSPDLAWTGELFGLVWLEQIGVDPPRLVLQWLDAAGEPVGGPVEVAAGDGLHTGRVTAADDGVVVVWSAAGEGLSAQRHEPGAAPGPVVRLADGDVHLRGAAWGAGTLAVSYTGLAPAFHRLALARGEMAPRTVNLFAPQGPPAASGAVWDGEVFTVALLCTVCAPAEVRLYGLPPEGPASVTTLPPTDAPAVASDPVLVHSPDTRSLGVLYHGDDGEGPRLRMARVRAGEVLGDEPLLVDERPEAYALAWGGAEYGLLWKALRGRRVGLFFNRLDTEGRPQGRTVPLPGQISDPFGLRLVWTGAEYALAFQDRRDGTEHIWFARGALGCPLTAE